MQNERSVLQVLVAKVTINAYSIKDRRSVKCIGKSNAMIGSVIHRVEALEEGIPVDEVQALARVGTNICDNEIYIVRHAADLSVQRARPDLRVGRELVGDLGHGATLVYIVSVLNADYTYAVGREE